MVQAEEIPLTVILEIEMVHTEIQETQIKTPDEKVTLKSQIMFVRKTETSKKLILSAKEIETLKRETLAAIEIGTPVLRLSLGMSVSRLETVNTLVLAPGKYPTNPDLGIIPETVEGLDPAHARGLGLDLIKNLMNVKATQGTKGETDNIVK